MDSLRARRKAAAEMQRIAQQGLGRAIDSQIIEGKRHVTVGGNQPQQVDAKYFQGFLPTYIEEAIGKDWIATEEARPNDVQHPLIVLKNSYQEFMSRKKARGEKSPFVRQPSAGTEAYIRLAYDIYSLEHNSKLQAKLVARLRVAEGFESAKYEIFVAATMVRAGFDLEFEDEDDRTHSHCEFSAKNKRTGRCFSVEAKCLQARRVGDPAQTKLVRRFYDALAKHANHERIIFIELNTQMDFYPGGPKEIISKGIALIFRQQALELRSKPREPAYVFLTNFPFHVTPESYTVRQAVGAVGFKIEGFNDEMGYRCAHDLRLGRKLHSEIFELGKSLHSQSIPPVSFDGDIAVYESGLEKRKPRIGEELKVDIGNGERRVGIVIDCGVMEARSEMFAAVKCENITFPVIVPFPLSPEEMAAWKAQPDTFFGVIRPIGGIKHPKDFYDWMLQNYSTVSKESLIRDFSSSLPAEFLNSLSDDDVREHCAALMTDSIYPHPWGS